MTENRTTELLREGLTERGVRWTSKPTHPETTWSHDGWWYNAKFEPWSDSTFKVTIYDVTPEQAIAATLGSERDEIYNAGFDNGIKATLHQLDGLLVKTDSAVEIQAWVDEQWKEYES